MEAHVGEESATASPEYLDPVGMPEVLVEKDARRYLWRTLDVPGADVAISNGAPLCK
jgi:hypothetical protein